METTMTGARRNAYYTMVALVPVASGDEIPGDRSDMTFDPRDPGAVRRTIEL